MDISRSPRVALLQILGVDAIEQALASEATADFARGFFAHFNHAFIGKKGRVGSDDKIKWRIVGLPKFDEWCPGVALLQILGVDAIEQALASEATADFARACSIAS